MKYFIINFFNRGEYKKIEKYKETEKIKQQKKRIMILKTFFSILFASLFIVLTKVKLTPIIGTDLKFSASVMFGPVISKFLGIGFGSGSIIGAHIFGILVGIYKITSILSFFTFFPIIFAGIYFSKLFKGEKRLIWIPIISISLFILHPIGSSVWFYSLFWTIPLFVALSSDKLDKIVKNYVARVYLYSLAAAFVDHSVGSVLFLYFMNIPREAWLTAIPLTIIERLIIGAGITLSYFFIRVSIKTLKEVFVYLAILEVEEQKEKIKVKAK